MTKFCRRCHHTYEVSDDKSYVTFHVCKGEGARPEFIVGEVVDDKCIEL